MRKGFTLVELSVVLVIVGLLISGVLIGQSMIETSKVNMQVKQIQQFDIAVANFTTAYGSIPGDSKIMGCVQDEATDPVYTGGGATCGDGFLEDSVIAGNPIPASYFFDWEISHFWVHLNKGVGFTQNGATFTNVTPSTGFDITSGNKNAPQAAIDSKTGVIPMSTWIDRPNNISMTFYALGDFSNYITGHENNSYSLETQGQTSITPIQAQALDTKMDDGLPYSGNVMALEIGNQTYWWLSYQYNQAPNCATATKYLTGNARGCGLMIEMMSGSGGMPYRTTTY